MRDTELADLAERCEIIAEALLHDATRVRTSRHPERADGIEAIARSLMDLARDLKPPE